MTSASASHSEDGRIVLADDSSLILDCARHAPQRQRQFTIAAALSDPDAVLQECARLQPDVIALDISMGERCGIDLAM